MQKEIKCGDNNNKKSSIYITAQSYFNRKFETINLGKIKGK